jgi:hypothetical protein
MLVDDQQDAERAYLDELASALQNDPTLQVHLEQQAKGGASPGSDACALRQAEASAGKARQVVGGVPPLGGRYIRWLPTILRLYF